MVLCRELRDSATGNLVQGAPAVAVLERDYRARQTVVEGDVRYSAAADAQRRAEFKRFRHIVVPAERRAGVEALRDFPGRDWRRWRRAVRRGEVIPTDLEKLAYAALRIQPWEVRRVARRLRTNRAADPRDALGSNLVRAGGSTLWLGMALLFDLRGDDPWTRTPQQVLHATPLYKGQGRDPADWLSYRLIMLLS